MMHRSMRPRLLLFPLVTELEWVIRPELEEWAEVATFDVPGVGDEPAIEPLDQAAIASRGLREVDGRGWDSYILIADGAAISTAVRMARERPDAVAAMALGHACLEHRMDGERPTINRDVMEAFAQLARNDYGNFVRYGLTQVTHGSIGDDLATRILERVPIEIGRAVWEMNLYDSESIEPALRDINVPLLFAKHAGCLGHTEEGFHDAVTAFPEARTLSVDQAPSVSSGFAEALKEFSVVLAREAAGRNTSPARKQSHP